MSQGPSTLLFAPLIGPLALALAYPDPQSANQQRPLPPVYFNHADISLDAASYEAIKQSSFLKEEFSGSAERTVQRLVGEKSLKYTFVNVEGRQTYLAFFNAGESEGHKKDAIAITFSIDAREELPAIRDSLAREIHTTPEIRVSTLPINGRNIAQYDTTQAVFPKAPEEVLTTVRILSFYPDFRRQVYPDLKPEEEGTTRVKDRARRYLSERLFNDVVGLTISANRTETGQLLQVLRALGFAIRTEGNRQIAAGPEIEIVLQNAEPGSPRKVAVDMKLNRAKKGEQSYQFGTSSEIRFKQAAATWYFPAGWRP